jgi:hypothetical protein
MAKDIAPRDLDLGGFRISNLGVPAAAGDATRTDNQAMPFPAGAPQPGGSLLAAPADHIHPAQGGLITLADPPLQVVLAIQEIWSSVVNFDHLFGDTVQVILSAMLQSCVVQVWLDGQVGDPTAGMLIMNIDSASPTLVPVGTESSQPFPRPAGSHLVQLTAQPRLPAAEGQTVGRVVMFKGLF